MNLGDLFEILFEPLDKIFRPSRYDIRWSCCPNVGMVGGWKDRSKRCERHYNLPTYWKKIC